MLPAHRKKAGIGKTHVTLFSKMRPSLRGPEHFDSRVKEVVRWLSVLLDHADFMLVKDIWNIIKLNNIEPREAARGVTWGHRSRSGKTRGNQVKFSKRYPELGNNDLKSWTAEDYSAVNRELQRKKREGMNS